MIVNLIFCADPMSACACVRECIRPSMCSSYLLDFILTKCNYLLLQITGVFLLAQILLLKSLRLMGMLQNAPRICHFSRSMKKHPTISLLPSAQALTFRAWEDSLEEDGYKNTQYLKQAESLEGNTKHLAVQ